MASPFDNPESMTLGAFLLAIILGLLKVIMVGLNRILSTNTPNIDQRKLRDDLREDIHEALSPLKEDIAELKRSNLAVRVAVLERRVDDLQQ